MNSLHCALSIFIGGRRLLTFQFSTDLALIQARFLK